MKFSTRNEFINKPQTCLISKPNPKKFLKPKIFQTILINLKPKKICSIRNFFHPEIEFFPIVKILRFPLARY